jgi:hypothetical protein
MGAIILKKTLKAVTIAAGLSLLSAPVASYAAGTTAVQYHNQWVKKGSYWTYYNAKGALQKGWLQVNSKWYFFDTNGYMKTGWVSSSNKWYYFDANGVMKTGWIQLSKQWYFLDASGAMKTGWVKSGQDWYFLAASGAMKTGWLQTGGQWYFLDRSSGKMTLGWKDIDGKKYYFYDSGAMAVNTTIDNKVIGADGAVYMDETDFMFKNIAGMASTEYGLSVEYDDEVEGYLFYNNADEAVGGFNFEGSVFGEPGYEDLWKKVALELGFPGTEAELNDLVEQARQEGEIFTEGIYIIANEDIFVIAWNFDEE